MHPACDLCLATAPPGLMHFHKAWHESQKGRLTPFLGDHHVDAEVTMLLQVVAALRAVAPVAARTEFVNDLRERLMSEALNRAKRSLSAVTVHSGDE
jgi:hypothetical protein